MEVLTSASASASLIFAAAACVAGDLKGLKGKLTCLGRGGDKSEAGADADMMRNVCTVRRRRLRGGGGNLELGTWKESSHDQDLSGATQRNSMTTFYERERAHQDGLKHDGLAGRVTSMVQ